MEMSDLCLITQAVTLTWCSAYVVSLSLGLVRSRSNNRLDAVLKWTILALTIALAIAVGHAVIINLEVL